jgi:hypothetical protein
MTEPVPPGEFRVELPNGTTIHRLPVARVNDAWHVFWLSWEREPGAAPETGPGPRRPREDSHRVHLEPVDGDLEIRSSGGHGNSSGHQEHVAFVAPGASAVRVVYRARDEVLATEEIVL